MAVRSWPRLGAVMGALVLALACAPEPLAVEHIRKAPITILTPVKVLVIDGGYQPASTPLLPSSITDVTCSPASLGAEPVHGTAVTSVLRRNIPDSVPVTFYFAAIGASGNRQQEAVNAACALEKVDALDIDVVNMSLDFADYPGSQVSELNEAVSAAANHAVVVTAVGNVNSTNNIGPPSTASGAFVVGASVATSYTPKSSLLYVDVADAGENVPAYVHSTGDGCDAASDECDGTSFAAPRVAALAVRVKAANGGATPDQIKAWLMANASPSGPFGLAYQGAGVINEGAIDGPIGSVSFLQVGTTGAGSGAVLSTTSRIECSSTSGGLCQMYYLTGSSITLSNSPIYPNIGMWDATCPSATATNCTFTISAATQSVTASFHQPTTLTIQRDPSSIVGSEATVSSVLPSATVPGSCALSSSTTSCTKTTPRSVAYTLQVTPGSGYVATWISPCTGTGSCNVTPTGATQTVTVKLTQAQAPPLSSASTNPNPAKQYTPFTLTLNGSNFNPATVEIVYSQPCFPPGSWCTSSIPNGSITTKTATQLTKTGIVFGLIGPVRFQVRNGTAGALSTYQTININPWP